MNKPIKTKKEEYIYIEKTHTKNACFVHFLYTVRSTVSKKYTKHAKVQS